MIDKLKQYPYLLSSVSLLFFLSLFIPGSVFIWSLVAVVPTLWFIGKAIKTGFKNLKRQ